jgi:magnesium chelatase family protein
VHLFVEDPEMSLSLVHSRALLGLEAPRVTVEVHLAPGLPTFSLVGLAETEVKEARERVRSALLNSGLEFPHNKRITVNLAPADLPKDSGRFDLPIALGILAASGQIDPRTLEGHEFAGELSLSGELRPVRGALAMALALRGSTTRLVLPPGSADEAALVPDLTIYMAPHLLDVVQRCQAQATATWTPLPAQTPHATATVDADLGDVKGQTEAKRALEIAAAGGHSLLLCGPPGCGKSMLAERLAGLLPPMTTDEALQSAALASLVGRFDLARWGLRPTCSPHHSASAVALVGGGVNTLIKCHHFKFPTISADYLRLPVISSNMHPKGILKTKHVQAHARNTRQHPRRTCSSLLGPKRRQQVETPPSS